MQLKLAATLYQLSKSGLTLILNDVTYRPAKDDCPRVKVDLNDVAFWHHLYPRHLPFGQHFIDEVIPGYIPTTGVDGVE